MSRQIAGSADCVSPDQQGSGSRGVATSPAVLRQGWATSLHVLSAHRCRQAKAHLHEQSWAIDHAFAFATDRLGLDQPVARIQATSGSVTIGLEATGHYWLAIHDHLSSLDHTVLVLRCRSPRPHASPRPTAVAIIGWLPLRLDGGRLCDVRLQLIVQIRRPAHLYLHLIE